MKTKEELNELKEKYESLKKEMFELSEEEFDEITGGSFPHLDPIVDPTDPRIKPIEPIGPDPVVRIMCKYIHICSHTGDKKDCPHYRDDIVCKY